MVVFAAAAGAQNLWLDGSNINGIRQDTTRTPSVAEIYGNYIGGGFKSSSQPTSAWTAGARANATKHLRKFSMKGSFAFEQFEGQGMAGSMFITPGTYPVDVIEFTPGRKTRQKYSFDGGISVDIAPGLRIGAKMDFLSANYTKRKDIRHTNYRLDMTFAPGIQYYGDDWAVGLNYIFHRDAETISAEQIGTAETSYYAFLDKGIVYGAYELWNGSGLHLTEAGVNGFPVKRNAHGFAAQFSYRNFFSELDYRHPDGTIGEKQFIWYRFPADEVALRLGYKYGAHTVKLTGKYKHEENNETVLEKISSGGVTNVTEHGSNLIYIKEYCSVRPEYSYASKAFRLGASLDLAWTAEQTSQMYPYIYTQDMFQVLAKVYAFVPVKGFLPGLALSYGDGFYSNDSRLASETSGVTTEPYHLERYWLGQMEYLTVRKVVVSPSLRYTFGMGLYLEAAANVLKAFNLEIIKGDVRCDATLKLGYKF